jgi:putative copper resistance protein D
VLPDLLSAILRGLGFIAVLQAGGAVLFAALMGHGLGDSRRAVLILARRATLAGAALLVAHYLLEPARMAGSLSGITDAGLQMYVLHSRAPLVLAMRLGGLLLLWLALRDGARIRGLGLAAAVLIAVSFAATGHTARSSLWWLLGPMLALHLLVVQFWFGSLLPLMWVTRREAGPAAARIVQRFSLVATWTVPLVLVAGVIIALVLLPDASALLRPYGLGLLLKVLAFAALMALAAANKWRLGPALEHGNAAGRLRFIIGVEFALIAAVLMGTAALTTFWSPES